MFLALSAGLISLAAAMVGTYNHRLIVLSLIIAILSSYAVLDLAGRVTSARGGSRYLWLSGGALAMAIGIWSVHHLGMLAYELPVPVEYDWPTVALSFLAAILASAIALFVVSQATMGLTRTLLGSAFMGEQSRACIMWACRPCGSQR